MQFVDFASGHGLMINQINDSGRIQRCGTQEHPKSLNGAYFFEGDRGWVYNWEHSTAVEWWNNPESKPWSQQEKDAWRKHQSANNEKREKEQQLVGVKAEQLLSETELKSHNYFLYKGFPDEEGLVSGDELLIPMRDFFTGKVNGVQRIYWVTQEMRYEKKMTYGMKAKGAVCWIGDKSQPEVFLCEGYATGLSIYAALKSVGLRAAVLVCFSANNMVFIAKHSKSKAYVFADNDKSGVGEAAAKSTGLPYLMSTTEGFDANDHHRKYGLMKLVGMIMLARMYT